jgi:hypothetical protein
MRGLAIGTALTVVLLLVPGGQLMLVLLIPLAFLALLMFRTTWQPVSTTYRPEANRTARTSKRAWNLASSRPCVDEEVAEAPTRTTK